MNDLSSTAGIVAISAGGVAVIALLTCVGLAVTIRRMRGDQKAILGAEERDLIAHAAALQKECEALSAYVQDIAARLDGRMTVAEQRIDGSLAHRSLVRYDAYGTMSGQQSTTIALLDANRSGIVLSSIHHRDSARMYVKQIHAGRPELELSPEEQDAVALALQGAGPSR